MFAFTSSAQTDATVCLGKEKTEKAECCKKDGENKACCLMTADGETENADLSKENTYCDIDCKSDDYCGGCLLSTYKTEYCVGTKCRNRTLYKCNVCGEKWWIYHD